MRLRGTSWAPDNTLSAGSLGRRATPVGVSSWCTWEPLGVAWSGAIRASPRPQPLRRRRTVPRPRAGPPVHRVSCSATVCRMNAPCPHCEQDQHARKRRGGCTDMPAVGAGDSGQHDRDDRRHDRGCKSVKASSTGDMLSWRVERLLRNFRTLSRCNALALNEVAIGGIQSQE